MTTHELLIEQNLYPVGQTNPPEYVPYDMLAPHEERALKNHGQTLFRLAERGGLCWGEILAILMDKPWSFALHMSQDKAREAVLNFIERRRNGA